MVKELMFSLGPKDFKITYSRSSGNGGQNVNKRDTKCQIFHEPSGARAQAQEYRTQGENKRAAFEKICSDPKFRAWISWQVGKISGANAAIKKRLRRVLILIT